MSMSLGGFRPGSGRKKGSIPWNKGVHSGNHGNGFKQGQKAWNKGIPMAESSKEKLRVAHIWSTNKGRKFNKAWRKKLSQAKLGKASAFKGKKHTSKTIKSLSIKRRNHLASVDPNYDYCLDSRTRVGNRRIRRERIKLYGGSHTLEQWNELKRKYNLTCPSCNKKEPEIKLTRDHIISLSNKGTDNIENIQPLCNSCNAKKSTKTIRY